MEKVYSPSEEKANCFTHSLGIVLGLIAGFLLLQKAYELQNQPALVSIPFYLVGMLFSYVASTCYHATTNPIRKKYLRKVDHAAIYFHIAGSYTPFMVLILGDVGYWSTSILGVVWVFALIGTLVSVNKLEGHSYLETLCYVLMGLFALVAMKALWDSLQASNQLDALYWLLGGGASFLVGALCYSIYRIPYMHTVFHLFVLLGSVCHIIAMWNII